MKIFPNYPTHRFITSFSHYLNNHDDKKEIIVIVGAMKIIQITIPATKSFQVQEDELHPEKKSLQTLFIANGKKGIFLEK